MFTTCLGTEENFDFKRRFALSGRRSINVNVEMEPSLTYSKRRPVSIQMNLDGDKNPKLVLAILGAIIIFGAYLYYDESTMKEVTDPKAVAYFQKMIKKDYIKAKSREGNPVDDTGLLIVKIISIQLNYDRDPASQSNLDDEWHYLVDYILKYEGEILKEDKRTFNFDRYRHPVPF